MKLILSSNFLICKMKVRVPTATFWLCDFRISDITSLGLDVFFCKMAIIKVPSSQGCSED